MNCTAPPCNAGEWFATTMGLALIVVVYDCQGRIEPMEKKTMSGIVELRTLSCTARGLAKTFDHPITIDDMENFVMDAGFSQYVPMAKSGDYCGRNLTSGDFPYDGDIEIFAYNAAK